MSPIATLFRSSIGRKFLMALSGIVLVGFAIGHLVGNLQIFSHPDHLNGYAEFLHNTGPMLWVVRAVMLLSLGVHVWAATVLTLENKRARGGQAYAAGKNWLRAPFASRYIRLTGYVVLAFVLYHLAHFTLGVTNPADFKGAHAYVMQGDYAVAGLPVVAAGTQVDNVYLMVYRGFESVPVSLFYIVAVGLLSLHLLHGIDSLFQTLGLRSQTWAGALRKIVALVCLLYFIGNVAIPGAILTGALAPHPAAEVYSVSATATAASAQN
ncbi:succinate dehydrogenase [Cephaloticoccus capnophilus]|uniref:Succinate dehydrogenase n=1 Tax=Cephaloticoccus capnophilus TaxID=1548208 RepID=A0A139SIU5_9BACT|nr:succinate dehydrogenase cytochrome b subunit [Cephaloticoccus capnophilus]KXU34414.1 succinate dehydrogenase [Cephaloticoccus capnophilus]